jgi:hypothetical protein
MSHKGKKKYEYSITVKKQEICGNTCTGIDLLLADFKSMKGEYENGERRRVILKVFLPQGVTKPNKEVTKLALVRMQLPEK